VTIKETVEPASAQPTRARPRRGLSSLATTTDREKPAARLLIEGAMLHLQADLDWLERCQEELV
jgi:hypothetical protein